MRTTLTTLRLQVSLLVRRGAPEIRIFTRPVYDPFPATETVVLPCGTVAQAYGSAYGLRDCTVTRPLSVAFDLGGEDAFAALVASLDKDWTEVDPAGNDQRSPGVDRS